MSGCCVLTGPWHRLVHSRPPFEGLREPPRDLELKMTPKLRTATWVTPDTAHSHDVRARSSGGAAMASPSDVPSLGRQPRGVAQTPAVQEGALLVGGTSRAEPAELRDQSGSRMSWEAGLGGRGQQDRLLPSVSHGVH